MASNKLTMSLAVQYLTSHNYKEDIAEHCIECECNRTDTEIVFILAGWYAVAMVALQLVSVGLAWVLPVY